MSIIRWPTTGIHSLALLWLLLNLCAAANIWYWPAYWEGLWDLALMPLLLFFLVRAQLSGRAPAVASRQPVCLTLYFVLYLALYSGGVAVALVGLYQWVNGSGTAVDNILRLTGPYFSPNHAALYLERTFFVGLGLLWAQWHTKHPATYCLLGSLVLVAVALLLTASRGAWLLGLPVGVVVFGWVGNSAGATAHGGFSTGRFRRIQQRMVALWHRRTWWMTSSAVVLIGLLVPIVFLFWARLTNSVTLAQRVMIWGSSFALWQDFFWVGVGPGGFFWRYPAYLPLGALDEPNLFHPHNLWLEVATGWGVWGLVWLGLLLWIISLHVRKIRSMAGPERWFWAGIVAAVAAAVAHGQVDAFLALPDLALWLWVILGTFAPRLGTFPSRPVAY